MGLRHIMIHNMELASPYILKTLYCLKSIATYIFNQKWIHSAKIPYQSEIYFSTQIVVDKLNIDSL